MFYSIGLMLLFVAVLLIFEHRSRFSWIFALMTLGAVVAFFFMILHLSTFADYGYYRSDQMLYRLDQLVFRYVKSHFTLPITLNIRLINLGIGFYLAAVMLMNHESGRILGASHARPIRRFAALTGYLLLPASSLILADPAVSLRMYLHFHTCSNPRTVFLLYRILELSYKAAVLVALAAPSVRLFREAGRIHVRFLRRRIVLLSMAMLLSSGLFFLFFFVGKCSISVSKVVATGFWIFDTVDGVIPSYYLNAAPVFIVLAVTAVILLSCQLDVLMTPLTERKIRRNIRSLNEAIGENLHSQKNLYFSMQILMRKIMQNEDVRDIPESGRLSKLIDSSLDRSAQMLNNLKNIGGGYYQNSLVQIVDQAVQAIHAPEYIQVDWHPENYREEEYLGTYNGYCLEQAIVNILHNAVEAIETAKREKGRVSVTLSGFFRWTVLSVEDNGCGLSGRERSSIFEPHYSGKKGRMNWGLGLPYVYRVVKAHLGQVRVESTEGSQTTIVILLPRDIHRRRKRME